MEPFTPKDYAEDLAEYLSTRFHPGKPHVGVVGPKPPDQEDIDLSEEDPFTEADSEVVGLAGAKGKVVFDFVPNQAHYSMTLTDQRDNLETKISFYIRISEGSMEDLANDGRSKEYILSKDELERSFRKYEVSITTDISGLVQGASVMIDGKKLEPSNKEYQEKIKIDKNEVKGNTSVLVLKIKDDGAPFLHQEYQGKTRMVDLDSQKYNIEIKKKFVKQDGGKCSVIVSVKNESKPHLPSSIPTREIPNVKEPQPETEQQCLERLKGDLGEDSLFSKWAPKLFNIEGTSWEIHGNTYGFLMEFNMAENGVNSTTEPYEGEYEKEIENVVNVVYDPSLDKTQEGRFVGCVKFKDNLLFQEKIPRMTKGRKPSESFEKNGLPKDLARVMEEYMGYDTFWKFQEDSIIEIQKALARKEDAAVLISARTGGGKTEAFMVPIINYCMEQSRNEHVSGTKALIFYPRKALANDQASRIIRFLFHVNKILPRKITIGILHGDVDKRTEEEALEDPQTAGIPLACPKIECDGSLISESSTVVKCNRCNLLLDFVLILTREPIYGLTPDIIVTNPETLQFPLMISPHHQGIFGREIGVCTDCHRAYSIGKRTCITQSCKGKIERIKPMPPKFIVFDEIHMFGGSFGINSSYFLSRLRAMIKRFAKNTHGLESYPITMIGSSATISNVKYFSEVFFNMGPESISIIPRDEQAKDSYYEEGTENIHRFHFFIMPHAYRPISTLSKSIGYLQEERITGKPPLPFSKTRKTPSSPLQILGFVNYTADSTQLIDAVQREFMGGALDIRVGGHSTDFDKGSRARAEKEFNQQILHVLFATPTLEVGVDFRTVNCVFLYGFPFSFNEYVQRIGRGGRKEATLVVTVCHPWKPIDQFFYSDARKKIGEQHKHLEPIPITRNNPDAIEKHLRASVFDIISSMDGSQSIMENISNLDSGMTLTKDQIIGEALKTIRIRAEEKDYVDKVTGFLDDMIRSAIEIRNTGTKVSMMEKFFDEYSPEYNLTNYRNSEPNVYVETYWEPM